MSEQKEKCAKETNTISEINSANVNKNKNTMITKIHSDDNTQGGKISENILNKKV